MELENMHRKVKDGGMSQPEAKKNIQCAGLCGKLMKMEVRKNVLMTILHINVQNVIL